MKYGIKIKGKLDNNGFYSDSNFQSMISEHTGSNNLKTLIFESAKEAEEYAKGKNLLDYYVEIVI